MLHDTTSCLRVLTVGFSTSDPNMQSAGRQFPSRQEPSQFDPKSATNRNAGSGILVVPDLFLRAVRVRKTQCEQMFSELPRITDIERVLARSPASVASPQACRASPSGEPRTPQTAGAQDRAACCRQRSRGLHGASDLVHASKVARQVRHALRLAARLTRLSNLLALMRASCSSSPFARASYSIAIFLSLSASE
jgi:hypothetical protein